jgi:hypothetical protein
MCQRRSPSDSNFKSIGEILMIDFNNIKSAGPLDQHQLKNNVSIELEKSQDWIKSIWYTNFVNLFMDSTKTKDINELEMDSFYASASILASNQVNIYSFA